MCPLFRGQSCGGCILIMNADVTPSPQSRLPKYLFFLMRRLPPRSPLFPYTTLFRSPWMTLSDTVLRFMISFEPIVSPATAARSEEHTSELQSRPHLVCRLLLEKK